MGRGEVRVEHRPADAARADVRRRALQLGVDAEDFVAQRLLAAGACLLARRWSGGGGELDLVAERGGRLRFIEVKARMDASFDPLEALSPPKVRRLRAAASAWLRAHAHDAGEVAFAIAVVDCTVSPWRLSWIDDAFDG
jgi:putative endonuclease